MRFRKPTVEVTHMRQWFPSPPRCLSCLSSDGQSFSSDTGMVGSPWRKARMRCECGHFYEWPLYVEEGTESLMDEPSPPGMFEAYPWNAWAVKAVS